VPGGEGRPARRGLQCGGFLRRYVPSGTRHRPGCLEVAVLGDFDATTLVYGIYVCMIYKTFGDASKVGLLVFLELSTKCIP